MQPLVPRSEVDLGPFLSLPNRRRVVILGSTGSIGLSTLDIISRFPEKFELAGIVAFGSKPKIFAEQILKFQPKRAILIDPSCKNEVEVISKTKLEFGLEAVKDLCRSAQVDIVVAAIVGAAGLEPVISALEASKIVALANKESLVVGGNLVREVCRRKGRLILPVDSEHSALFQSLLGIKDQEIDSLTLTASGGPFLKKSLAELESILPEQAIKHPKWQMGPKISVDSATLVNKALELIEAHYLFAIPANRLSAVVHPQSIIHSIVNIKDGSSLLQASNPDMREPIAFALGYPNPREDRIIEPLNLAKLGKLEFKAVDPKRFPAVKIALNCIEQGSLACITLNQANEYAVDQFLKGRLRFVDILPFIEEVLSSQGNLKPSTLEEILYIQKEILSHCDFVMDRFKLG